jgi:hypothetical protein
VDPLQSALLVKQATAPAPPLTKLRPDIPRPLASAIHSLLAKLPEERPRTAAIAKAQLEKSLAGPERIVPEIEPLSSTVAAVNPAHSIIFRVGAPLSLVVMFGALLAWGYTGESASVGNVDRAATASLSSIPAQTTPASYRVVEQQPSPPPVVSKQEKPAVVEPRLKLEQARKIAAGLSNGNVGGVQVIETDSGTAIVAVETLREKGKTNFLLIERGKGKYRVSMRGSLEFKGWQRASWSTELADADEDGYQEVIFSGRESREGRRRQLVLFVPNDKRTYSMLLTGETTSTGTPRIIWLANAVGTDAAAYRTALRQKARVLVAKR